MIYNTAIALARLAVVRDALREGAVELLRDEAVLARLALRGVTLFPEHRELSFEPVEGPALATGEVTGARLIGGMDNVVASELTVGTEEPAEVLLESLRIVAGQMVRASVITIRHP